MKHSVLILGSLLLAASLATPAYANTPHARVVLLRAESFCVSDMKAQIDRQSRVELPCYVSHEASLPAGDHLMMAGNSKLLRFSLAEGETLYVEVNRSSTLAYPTSGVWNVTQSRARLTVINEGEARELQDKIKSNNNS